ncbi:MAG TPA: hypothetical protein VM345_00900 [Acidimicrobiales bacterium]|jgi:hypothetical protein|nr:hypothetical protein [Acidimicrobiales bacterium]
MKLPMSALLAQALGAVTHEYEQRGAGSADLPRLAVWSNVLRPVGDGADIGDLPQACRLSKRAVRAAVHAAEKAGWLIVEGKAVHLSPAGQAARERWPSLDGAVDSSFSGSLSGALRDVVCQLYLEWPHYPTGYGPADHSITGGVYMGGGQIDSKVPTHGQDWSPVLRQDINGSSVAGLPVSALLSQAFLAFATDFEELWIGGLHLAATVLRLLPDEGAPITDIPFLSRLKGDGKSVLERHGFLDIRRDAGNPKLRIAVPTARGRHTRDEYQSTVDRVEQRWSAKYGADAVATLRTALESLSLDPSLPHSVIDTLT